jgi:hypothetical protein
MAQPSFDNPQRESESGDRKVAGYAGILFFVWLVIAGVVYGGVLRMPLIADTAAYHRQYYVDHSTAVLVHAWLSGLCWAWFFLVFATGLRGHLTPGTRERGIWPRLTTAGAVLTVALGGTGLIFESVAAGVARDASDELLVVLARMVQIVDATLLYWGLSLFVVSASMVILRSGRLNRGLAWFGYACGLLMVIGAAWPLTGDDRGALALIGLAGLTLLGVWALVTAIALLRSGHEPHFSATA